jgi:hypothetical protein
MLLLIPGYNEDGEFQAGEFVVIFLMSLAVSAVLFLYVVPRGGAVTALVLAVIALVSIVVFWAGLTLPLAAAAAVAAWKVRSTGQRNGLAMLALVLAAITAVALVAVIVGDATAN